MTDSDVGFAEDAIAASDSFSQGAGKRSESNVALKGTTADLRRMLPGQTAAGGTLGIAALPTSATATRARADRLEENGSNIPLSPGAASPPAFSKPAAGEKGGATSATSCPAALLEAGVALRRYRNTATSTMTAAASTSAPDTDEPAITPIEISGCPPEVTVPLALASGRTGTALGVGVSSFEVVAAGLLSAGDELTVAYGALPDGEADSDPRDAAGCEHEHVDDALAGRLPVLDEDKVRVVEGLGISEALAGGSNVGVCDRVLVAVRVCATLLA